MDIYRHIGWFPHDAKPDIGARITVCGDVYIVTFVAMRDGGWIVAGGAAGPRG